MKLAEFDWGDYSLDENYAILHPLLKDRTLVIGTEGRFGQMIQEYLEEYEMHIKCVGENPELLAALARGMDGLVIHVPTLGSKEGSEYMRWESNMNLVMQRNRRVVALTYPTLNVIEQMMEDAGCIPVKKIEAYSLLPFALATLFLLHPTDI
jgi:hypothetical protein